MATINRRKFINSTVLVTTMGPILSSFGNTGIKSDEKLIISIPLVVISEANNPEEDLKVVRDLGVPTCQLEKPGTLTLVGRNKLTTQKTELSSCCLFMYVKCNLNI